MKKSEMVAAIVDELKNRMHFGTIPAEELAEHILKRVEDEGMLPPEIENVHCFSSDGYLSLDAALKRGIRSWEEE